MPRTSRRLSEDDERQRLFGQVDPSALEALEKLSGEISTGLAIGIAEMVRLIKCGDPETVRVAAFRTLAAEADLKGLIRNAQALKALMRVGPKDATVEEALVALLIGVPEATARKAFAKAYSGGGGATVVEAEPVDDEDGDEAEEPVAAFGEAIDLSVLKGV